MPKVGNKMFSYDKKGKMEAKEYGKKMGKPVMNMDNKMREMKPKGITITMMLKSRKSK